MVESLTGYPRDLLDLDLDLEADLGVDTVKQAEVFAAVRERFAIPRQDDLKLRDFPTLAHVIGFVHDRAPSAAAALAPSAPVTDAAPAAAPDMAQTAPPETTAAERPVEPVPAAPQGADPVATPFSDVVESLTGYPRDLLDLDLDLEADLGVDTVKQAEVFAAVRERFAIPRQDNLKLRDFPTLTHVIGFVRDHAVGAPAAGVREPETAEPEAAPSPRQAAGDRTPRRLRSRRRPPSPATRQQRSACRGASRCRCCGRRRSGASPPP